MLLWFVGMSWVVVWLVFQDPAIDYRLVMAGAVLPDLIDGPWGGARLAHTLAFSVGLLGFTMIVTGGRRSLRRRLLALPIGTFMHLVLDAMWARTRVFWWPVFGTSFHSVGLPSLSHPTPLVVLEEILGALALAWGVHRFGLGDPGRRIRFVRTGRLDRRLGGAGPRG